MEKWKEKSQGSWRGGPQTFVKRRSRLFDLGSWRREEEDGGRTLKEEDIRQREGERRKQEEIREVELIEMGEAQIMDHGGGNSEKETEEEIVADAATVGEDLLFGQTAGYPTTRRPVDFGQTLTTEPWEKVNEWFQQSGITVGAGAKTRMESDDPEKAESTARLLYTWKDLFVEDLVAMPATDLVTHAIHTWDNAIPVCARDKLYTPREREWMERVLPQMLEAGVIDHSVSPWCHRTKFVPKKDGDLRMVHNYVPINAATVPNSYPMKRIEPILNSLMKPGLKVYFQADAANGYWAVPLKPEHAYKTAFGTHIGQFQYLRMGQGLSGAPQTYTRLKDILSGAIPELNAEPALSNTGIPGVYHYFMDDDFGAHATYQDQWDFLHYHYLPRMAWGRMTMRPKKTGFFLDRINQLGFALKGEGLRPSEDKVAAIRDYPRPTNMDELNKFLWMTTFLRHFIPGRADHTIVLKKAATMETAEEWHRRDPGRRDKKGRLLRGPRKVVHWEWGEEQEFSFGEIKKGVLQNAVFGGEEEIQYHLATDASKTGIGGVLFQMIDTEPGTRAQTANKKSMRIIMFISLRLSGAESRYSTTEREALAVVRCLQEVRWLVQGSRYVVLVYTDHSALIHLLKHDDAHGRVARWQLKLSEYDTEYIHIPGTQNVIADGLSRMPERFFGDRKSGEEEEERIRKKENSQIENNKGNGGKDRKSGEEEEERIRKKGNSQIENNKGNGGKDRKSGEEKEERIRKKGNNLIENKKGNEGKGIKPGEEELGTDGEKEVQGPRQEEGELGGGLEVLSVEKVGGDQDAWELWKGSDWYGEIVRFLLCGDFKGRDLTAAGRRRIRMRARRFLLFDGQQRKGLFYKERGGKLSLCILEGDVVSMLTRYHDRHGHFAGRLLVEFLIGRAFWPTRGRDAYYFARTCNSCQSMGPLQPSVGSGTITHLQPFDMVGLDFIGPITPISAAGNRYIIIMVDYFTRYLFARAVPQGTGVAARNLFESVTEQFGNPLSVYTDNSAHFTGEEFHGMLVKREIRHFLAPKSHPSSVGLAERYVQLLMGIIKRRVQTTDKALWDTLIASAVQTLNTRGVKVHGFTPAELLLGYNPRAGPLDDISAHIILDSLDGTAHALRLAQLNEDRGMAQENLVAVAQEKEAREQEKQFTGVELRTGDLVLLRRFNVIKHHGLKLEPQWEGPYRLVDIAYHSKSGRLQDLETGEIVRVRRGGLRERVHVNDLKLFIRRDADNIPDSSTAYQFEANGAELKKMEEACGWKPGVRRFRL